jgi:hypothetical protein
MCQQYPEPNLDLSLATNEPGAMARNLANTLITLLRNISEWNLIDPKQLSQKQAVQPIRLTAPLQHRA